MTRVLVIDDEPQILRALRINLRARHYEVSVAATGTEALEVAPAPPLDLVILGLGLPDMDGVDVIGGLRGWASVPIIVLSGRADSTDKGEGLDARAAADVTQPSPTPAPPSGGRGTRGDEAASVLRPVRRPTGRTRRPTPTSG